MKKYILLCIISISLSSHLAYASQISLVQTKDIYTGLVTFDVMLDPENTAVNTFSGGIVFPVDVLSIESISTVGSIVPLWLTQPSLFKEDTFFGAKIQIVFEGVLPGGFDGVRSPYTTKKEAGKLFTVTFRPKTKGQAFIFFSDVKVLRNDGKASEDLVTTNTATITIPDLQSLPEVKKIVTKEKRATESLLDAYIIKDNTIAPNTWILIIHDDTTRHTVSHYEVAESSTYTVEDVTFYEWKEVTSPYILSYQKRNRFVHIKALYADGTYSVVTLAPVENIDDEANLWRILVVLGLSIFILYLLQKNKQERK